MSFAKLGFVTVCAAALVLAGSVTMAQVKKGKSRLLETKQLMGGLIKVQCDAVKKSVDSPPGDEKGWAALATSAALLNEASYVLMEDGRCPDATWADAASKVLRDGSAAVVKAAETKDSEAAKKAFGEMTKACGACHKAHKK